MGKSGGSYKVVKYYMSSWWGFCVGPVDKLIQVFVNDKSIWSGSLDESSVISVDARDRFGGLKREGGVFGSVTYLDGKDTQTIPEYLAQKLGLTSATCPAHRGIASVFFSGGIETLDEETTGTGVTSLVHGESDVGGLNSVFSAREELGFYWRANYPAVPPMKVKAQRAPKGLNPAYAMIGPDANVVHTIYETMVNTDWGLGIPTSAIDTATFESAAHTTFLHGVVVSLLWTEQQSGDDFIIGLLEYIQGMIYVDPRTGLITIKLISGGYDVETLFEINVGNAKLDGFQRKMWGETVNELVVTWTNPKNEQEETVTVQDIGNIAMQGGIVSDTRDYKGIRSAALAMKLAMRDLRVVTNPLMSCRAVINRTAWEITPGDVVKLTWAEHGLSGIPMRVTEVDYGKIGDGSIKVMLVEDIFGLEEGVYFTPPSTSWVTPEIAPKQLDYSFGMTLPYYMTARSVGVKTLIDPDVRVAVLGADAALDISSYHIIYETVNAADETIWLGSEQRGLLSKSTLTGALSFAALTSTVGISDPTHGAGYARGSIVLIGEDEATQELCVISAISGDNITIRRGMMDTVPRSWSSGTPIWLIPATADVVDNIERVAGDTITYRLLSITSLGTQRIVDADDLDVTLSRRPWLPLRPANCKVNGVASGTVTDLGATSLALTWANRNRTYEDAILLDWSAGTVTPEAGQTTTIRVYADDQTTLLDTINGLSGTSYSLATTSFGAHTSGYVKFTSKKGADESLQGHMIRVVIG